MAKYCLLRNKNKIIAILKLLLFYASFSLAFSAFAQKNNLELVPLNKIPEMDVEQIDKFIINVGERLLKIRDIGIQKIKEIENNKIE